jgi:hypothetical protein
LAFIGYHFGSSARYRYKTGLDYSLDVGFNVDCGNLAAVQGAYKSLPASSKPLRQAAYIQDVQVEQVIATLSDYVELYVSGGNLSVKVIATSIRRFIIT